MSMRSTVYLSQRPQPGSRNCEEVAPLSLYRISTKGVTDTRPPKVMPLIRELRSCSRVLS
jgi:hypothetical protein